MANQYEPPSIYECCRQSNKINRGWRRIFSKDDDKIIIDWVQTNGARSWKNCSKLIVNKTMKQVRDRWFNVLDPSFHFKKWNSVEDYLVFKLYEFYGPKWAQISEYLYYRSPSQTKNRFYGLLKSSKYKGLYEISSTASRKHICELATKEIDAKLGKKKVIVDLSSQQIYSEILNALYSDIKVENTLTDRKVEFNCEPTMFSFDREGLFDNDLNELLNIEKEIELSKKMLQDLAEL